MVFPKIHAALRRTVLSDSESNFKSKLLSLCRGIDQAAEPGRAKRSSRLCCLRPTGIKNLHYKGKTTLP